MHYPTFADIQRAKLHAKKLKSVHPELSHAQRLDKAATELFRVRDYHELNRRFDRVINEHVDTPGGANSISHCRYCDYKFAADVKGDRQLHRERHECFMEAVELLGYRPGNHVERERMKSDGYDQNSSGPTGEDRLQGALMVARGWFERSLHNAIHDRYWAKHPDFDTYVAMIGQLMAETFPEQAEALGEIYGHRPGEIAVDETRWYPS